MTASGSSADTCRATKSHSWRTTMASRCGLMLRAARRAWPTMERPPISWRILGVRDFIRVPAPAARTITAAGPDFSGLTYGLSLLGCAVLHPRLPARRCPGVCPEPATGFILLDTSDAAVPPIGFEPILHGSKGRGAAITPERTMPGAKPGHENQ